MIIDLAQIEKEAFFDLTLEPSRIDWDEEDVILVEPLGLRCNVYKDEGQVKVEGTIKTVLRAYCSRCFDKTCLNVDLSFRAIFVSRERFPKDVELELKKEDLDISIFEGEKLDFAEVVREQILVSLPTQVLCRPDCKGLCGICWVNLNKDGCECSEKEIDIRLAKLKELYRRRN